MSGFFAAHGRWGTDLLDRIAGQAKHRGAPDVFTDEQVALVAFGSRVHVAEDLVVAADARIDVGPAGDTHAARIAAAWRAGTWQDLIGDYAAAIWDRRARTLHVVRDAIGGRPALTCATPERMTAGSSIAMLLADPAVPREIDGEWVRSFLTIEPRFRTASGYRAIARLAPGDIAHAEGSGWRTQHWYDLPRARVRFGSDAEYAQAFRALFEQSVRDRIGDATRVAIPLSGGLDSTSVAVTARHLRTDVDLLAMSMPFRKRKGDERALQTMVAERARMRLRWVEVTGQNPYGVSAEETIEAYGTPFVSPNSFHIEALADAAAEDGAQVVLDGIDGDGVIGGNFFFIADLLATGRWHKALRELNAMQRTYGSSRKRVLKRLGIAPLIPQGIREAYTRVRGNDERPSWLADDLRIHGAEEPWRPGRAFSIDRRLSLTPDSTPQVLEVLDEQYARRGLRIEHPFMDRRLIEFCANLPREQVTADGYTKVVLRAAMRDLLPAAVTERAAKADVSEALLEGLTGVGREETQRGLAYLSRHHVPWVREEGVRALAEICATDEVPYEAFRVAWMGHWLTSLEDGSVVRTAQRRT